MISAIVDTVFGSALSVVLLLLGLFPTIDVDSLPIQPPALVTDALGALNCFVPIGDLITILTVWIGLLLAINVALAVARIVSLVK